MIAVFNAELNRCQRELSLKQYEASINTDKLEQVTTKLTDLEAIYGKKNLINNSAYKDLVSYQMTYDTKKDSLESEMKILEASITTYKSARNENIKKEVSFWCFG